MKFLVETTGDFSLYDHSVKPVSEIPNHRPAVVPGSNFISTRQHLGQLQTLAQLKDTATDAEFEKYWKEANGNRDLAIDSFLSGFVHEPAPIEKKKAKK